MADYLYAEADNRDRRRLATIAAGMDPGTFELLGEIGVEEGDRCLDVGAGVGTVAEWLADGAAVSVVATDIDTGWLKALQRADIEVRDHDITTGPVEEGGFDLVHARAVLTHVRGRQAATDNLVRSTRPGGWVVLEDPDMSTMGRGHPHQELFERFCRTLEGFITAGGGDPRFGTQLPAALCAAGLEDVGFRERIVPNSDQAMLEHLEGVADRLVEHAIFTPEEIRSLTAYLQDEQVLLYGLIVVAAWGRVPRSA
jgi:SAM-dependent methyltransferase